MIVGQNVEANIAQRITGIVGAEHVMEDVPADQTVDWWPLALKNDTAYLPDLQPALRVSPGNAGEVAAILKLCSETGTPVTAYGGASGVVGAAIPAAGGILLDLVRLRNVRRIDRDNLLVTADAGLVGGLLEERLQEQGFTLGIYPQSLNMATLGGWVAMRATGTHVGNYGGIEDRLVGLEVALADGTLAQTPLMPHWAIGPDLAQLFVGSEGALGVITGVTLRMARNPRRRLLRALQFDGLQEALYAARILLQYGLRPAVVRLYDKDASGVLGGLTYDDPPGCVLILAFEGPEQLTDLQEELSVTACIGRGATDLGRKPAERWDAQRLRPPTGFAELREPGVMADEIDVQAPWDRLLDTYHVMRDALRLHCTRVIGYFGHVYEQGSSIYFVISIEAADDEEAVRRYHLAWNAAMEAALSAGATIAHNRGIGLARAPWFADALGDAAPLWERLKQAFDPTGILNPGKLNATRVEAFQNNGARAGD